MQSNLIVFAGTESRLLTGHWNVEWKITSLSCTTPLPPPIELRGAAQVSDTVTAQLKLDPARTYLAQARPAPFPT